MIDKIELGNVKQVIKTLLIVSFIGFSFNELVQFSTGELEFLGFKIPIEDATVIPSLIGYIIIYLLFALIIRYSDENFQKKYKDLFDHLNRNSNKKGN